jgi:hypothetical protein
VIALEKPFPAAYELALEVELPPGADGPLQLFYPEAREAGGSSDLLIKVMPSGREPWLANFAADDYPLTVATTCPDPQVFCVIARGLGYLVRVDDPRVWSEVRAIPVLQVFPDSDHKLLLFADFTRIAAYGEAGLVWRADLVMDGLKILSRTGTEVSIRGDNYAAGEERLVIDVTTGELVQLPCGHRDWTIFIKPYPGRECSVCGQQRINPQ